MKKTILITGGSQRIGRSIALFLKDSNYNFIIHYNKSSKAARAVSYTHLTLPTTPYV